MNQLRKLSPADPSADRGDAPVAAATDELSQLSAEADGLLRKLVRLRDSLNAIRDAAQNVAASEQLVATNQELVRAALHAGAVAETAVSRLGDLARSSQHDALTGLPNRTLMIDRVTHAIAAAKRRDTRVGVLFIDLDNFKQVNDSLGHAAGDAVLKLAARRLRGSLRKSDTVSRHGGEEFLVLLPEIASAVDAADVAGKLLAALSAPASIAGQRLDLSASVGVAIYPEDGEDASVLIERADAAMYRAKHRGPGRFEFFAEKRSMQKPGSRADVS